MMCVDDHKVQASCDEKTKLGMYPMVEFFPPLLFNTTVISLNHSGSTRLCSMP